MELSKNKGSCSHPDNGIDKNNSPYLKPDGLYNQGDIISGDI